MLTRRRFLPAFPAALAGLAALQGCGHAPAGPSTARRPDTTTHTPTGARLDLVVGPGEGVLAAAFARAEAAGGQQLTIGLEPGVYREKLVLNAANVTLVGLGPGADIVSGVAAGHVRPDGERWGTTGSASLTIAAPGCTLRNLTIRNDFDYVGARRDPAGNGHQAVALAVGRDADRTAILGCRMEGYQDTLLLQARTLIEASFISGCVDFIFGGAAAWIADTEILQRHVPDRTGGFLLAPSTLASQAHGLVLSRCRLTREAGVPDGSIHLGRPWRAGGNMDILGMAAVLDCWMDAHIAPGGWTSMGYRNPAGVRVDLTPEEARLAEFGSTGPGAGPASATRRMLSPEQAAALTRNAVLGDWSPSAA